MPCWLASFSHEIARASNSAVKRLEASAHGQSHDARPVLGAVAARRPGVQDRAVLTGVEVTPAAFGLMIVECAHGAALAARPADLLVVFEEDVDFAVGSAQAPLARLSRDFRCPESGGIARGLASRETTTEPHSPTRNPEEPKIYPQDDWSTCRAPNPPPNYRRLVPAGLRVRTEDSCAYSASFHCFCLSRYVNSQATPASPDPSN